MRPIVILGGILALLSLFSTWWISYYTTVGFQSLKPMYSLWASSNQLVYNVTPLYFRGSPGVQLNETSLGKTLGTTHYLIQITIMLTILAGLIGIGAGVFTTNTRKYGIAAAVMIFAAIFVFSVALINMVSGAWILFGSINVFGTEAIWSLGPGVVIAIISMILLLLSCKRRKRPNNKINIG